MKIPKFQKFMGRAGARYGSSYIGISKGGSITVYSGLYIQENLKNFKTAEIFYDKEQRLLGIKFTQEEPKEGFVKLHHSESGKNASIGASNFFKFYNLTSADYAGRYTPNKIKDETAGEVFMIDLNEKLS